MNTFQSNNIGKGEVARAIDDKIKLLFLVGLILGEVVRGHCEFPRFVVEGHGSDGCIEGDLFLEVILAPTSCGQFN